MYIFCRRGLASRRRCRLNSNVRQHNRGRAVLQQSQRLRREFNLHNAAKPRTASLRQRAGQRSSVGCGRTELRSSSAEWKAKQGHVRRAVPHDSSDKGAPCHIEPLRCVGSPAVQSVRRPAAASIGASGHGQLMRRLQRVACHARRRGAGSTCGGPPGTTWPWRAQHPRSPAVLPNPSLKRSANGRPPGPGRRYGVHCLQPGPGVLPSSPA